MQRNVAATNVALKIVCRRHVTRIDILRNNVTLKIVVKIVLRNITLIAKWLNYFTATFPDHRSRLLYDCKMCRL